MHLYMYIHIHMHIYICIYICVCKHMYMHIYVHVQIKSLKMSGIANCAYVFIVNAQNEADLIEVTTGIQDNQYIAITSGLEGGEKVIFAPYSEVANKLKKKTKVKIVDKKELFVEEKE